MLPSAVEYFNYLRNVTWSYLYQPNYIPRYPLFYTFSWSKNFFDFFSSSCENLDHGYYANPDSVDCSEYFVCLPIVASHHRLESADQQRKRKRGSRRWNFHCGPGTIFSENQLACVHNDGSCGN